MSRLSLGRCDVSRHSLLTGSGHGSPDSEAEAILWKICGMATALFKVIGMVAILQRFSVLAALLWSVSELAAILLQGSGVEVTTGELFSSSTFPTVKGEPLSCNARSILYSNESHVPVQENPQHSPQWTVYLGGETSSSLLHPFLVKSSVMNCSKTRR